MADHSPAIELSLSELREVAGYAAACARPALEIFGRERPDDRRPRAALDAAQTFADGGPRIKALRDGAWPHTGRLKKPATRIRLRQVTPHARRPTRAELRSFTRRRRRLRSSTSSGQPLMPRERSSCALEPIPP